MAMQRKIYIGYNKSKFKRRPTDTYREQGRFTRQS